MSYPILDHLSSAEQSLRQNLHRHDLDPVARSHMERAISHVREAFVATREIGQARSVRGLVNDMEKVERMVEVARERHEKTAIIKINPA